MNLSVNMTPNFIPFFLPHQENKMDVMNLSVIMTPNFMPAPIDEKEGKSSVSSQGEESKSLERRTNVVAFLLKMAKK